MYKSLFLIMMSLSIFSASLIYNATTSKQEFPEKFDAITKATKPKGSKLFS